LVKRGAKEHVRIIRIDVEPVRQRQRLSDRNVLIASRDLLKSSKSCTSCF